MSKELFKEVEKLIKKIDVLLPKDVEDKKDDEPSIIEKLASLIEDIQQDYDNVLEDKMLAVADKQNSQKRYQQDAINARKYGGEKLASEMIPSIDTFRKVLSAPVENPELQNYLAGFTMILNQIDQSLSNAGIELINTKIGDLFNPEIHSALEQVETEEYETGQICMIVSNGYKLYDRVIKHANVKVANKIDNKKGE